MTPFLKDLKVRLLAEFPGAGIELRDFSAEHAGHEHGAGAGGHRDGTHVEIRITSERFASLRRLQRERLIHQCLKAELNNGRIHALVLQLKTPAEV